jgi:hypothetical protein
MQPTTTRLTLLALVLVLFLAASSAHAQYPIVYAPVPPAAVSVDSPGGIPPTRFSYFPSYSYWTAAYYGYPARIYIGLGSPANDFPYFGQPYGSPSDPWSWPAMSGYPNGVPTRYYPVLR